MFQSFARQYNKAYESREMENYRFAVFTDNYAKIQAHNARLDKTFTMGMNHFGDLTVDEYKERLRGYDTSVLQRSGKDFHNETGIFLSSSRRARPPAEIDWVAQGKVTEVKDQEYCGGCWAFAVADSLESRYAIAHNTRPVSLSVQEQLDCNHDGVNEGCVGGNLPEGFDYIIDHGGLCLERDYKFQGEDNRKKCRRRSRHCRTRSGQVKNYGLVMPNSEKALKAAVAQGPVAIAIEAEDEAMQFYEKGVFTSRNCGGNVNHAMTIVGYGIDRGLKYWKIKGTWSDSWGEGGYIRICRECGRNGRTGECGVTVEAVFPII